MSSIVQAAVAPSSPARGDGAPPYLFSGIDGAASRVLSCRPPKPGSR